MSFDAGTLKGYLTLDGKQYEVTLKKAQKQTDTFGENIKKNSKKIKDMGIAMSVAGGLIVAGITKTIQAASNAAEVSTKFAFTFRDIKNESSEALKDLVNNYGMSVVSGQKLLASTGDIYKGFGANSEKALGLSVAIQKLAADHTSFNNVQGGVARASEIITKATLGERDGLIQLGIKVSEQMVMERLALQGKEKLTGAALFLAKSEATLALITEQSGGAIGDYGRTAEGTANQSRLFGERLTDLKVLIGTQLLPAITPLISGVTSFVTKMIEWTKEHPILTKAIVTTTASLGALLLVVGPILIALPKMAAGLAIVKGAMESLYIRALYLKDALPGIISGLGKVAAAGAAFYVGWKVGEAIDDFLGLSEAIQKGFDAIHPSLEFYEKLSTIKAGWTDQGKQALFLKDSLIELAKEIDPTVTGLKSAAQVLKNNAEAYENLHRRQKRVVDGLTEFPPALQGVIDKAEEIPVQTEEQRKALESILETSGMRIKELTLSETDFKIEQLNREYQKNIELLKQNAATKTQLQLLERTHTLEISKIREEAYKAQQEKDKKREEEEKKAKEEERKAKEAELKKEEDRQQRHFDFLDGLKKEQQDLVLQQIEERDGWYAAELARLDIWHSDQYDQLYQRLTNELITFEEFQTQKTAILETGEMKREAIENEARKREEKAEMEKEKNLWSNFESMTSKKQAQLAKYFAFISNLNTVYTAIRESQLNSWYDQEYARIMASSMSNEERSIAIENLDAQMHAKKAALEAQAQKRERAMAIAQAIANTAVAITTALKSLPWPLNLPAIAFAIATGAAQIAAIGGAYKAPGLESFAPGGGEGGGAGGGGNGGAGGGPDAGRGGGVEVPAFQTGTEGYISPPRDFIVGDPYSPERVQLRGNLENVGMSITPLGQTAPTQSGVNINLDFSGMNIIDATDFENRVREFLPRLIQQLFNNGIVNVPRARVR